MQENSQANFCKVKQSISIIQGHITEVHPQNLVGTQTNLNFKFKLKDEHQHIYLFNETLSPCKKRLRYTPKNYHLLCVLNLPHTKGHQHATYYMLLSLLCFLFYQTQSISDISFCVRPNCGACNMKPWHVVLQREGAVDFGSIVTVQLLPEKQTSWKPFNLQMHQIAIVLFFQRKQFLDPQVLQIHCIKKYTVEESVKLQERRRYRKHNAGILYTQKWHKAQY